MLSYFRDVMDTWTTQPGFPLLTATNTGGKVKITQERFLTNPEESPSDLKYKVPIRYRTSSTANSTTQIKWMPDNADAIELDIGSATWYKLNEDQVGYYRVNYDEANWMALIAELKKNEKSALNTLNRANLLNDASVLADSQKLNYNIPLDMFTYLVDENHLIPWSVAIAQFSKMMNLLYSDPIYGNLTTFAHDMADKIYKQIRFSNCVAEPPTTPTPPQNRDDTTTSPSTTVPSTTVSNCVEEGEDALTDMLREKLVSFMCRLEDPDCLANVDSHFDDYDANETIIDPNVRQSVYYYGLRNANQDKWQKIYDRFRTTNDAQEHTKLMYALSAPASPSLLRNYIDLAIFGKQQDFLTVLQYISENPNGESLVWDYVRENWGELVKIYTINERTLGRLIPNITKRFSTQTRLNEVRHPEQSGVLSRSQLMQFQFNNSRFSWTSSLRTTLRLGQGLRRA